MLYYTGVTDSTAFNNPALPSTEIAVHMTLLTSVQLAQEHRCKKRFYVFIPVTFLRFLTFLPRDAL